MRNKENEEERESWDKKKSGKEGRRKKGCRANKAKKENGEPRVAAHGDKR